MTRARSARVGAFLLAVSAGAGCSPREAPPAAGPPAVDTAAVLAGLAAHWDRWATAVTAGDLEAYLQLGTDSVRYDVMGFPPLSGREAIRAAFAPAFAQARYLEAVATPTATVPLRDDLAHQAGTYLERYALKGQPGEVTDYGRYAAAFVRGADGLWRFAYVMAMTDSTVRR